MTLRSSKDVKSGILRLAAHSTITPAVRMQKDRPKKAKRKINRHLRLVINLPVDLLGIATHIIMSHMNIVTDAAQIEALLTRGVEAVYPSKDFLRKLLLSGKQLTLYNGIDPTGPTLHIGHGITLHKLAQFQKLGHKIILLIGDFTAMIGDPTDKLATRVKQTKEQVLENAKLYRNQASHFLEFGGGNPAELRYNSEWWSKMTYADGLELASNLTHSQMIKRDMFQKRIEEGKDLFMHELSYPMMQGYDSVAMDVDGEVGGNDQTFNMLVGRDLMKKRMNKEKFVVSTKLLVDPTGKKMGKTEGNMVAFTDR